MPPPNLLDTKRKNKTHSEISPPPVDQALAERLMVGHSDSNDLKNFIIHLSIACRQGHLCITTEEPHPKFLWKKVVEGDGDWDGLAGSIKRGAALVPKGMPIIVEGGRYYFRRYYNQETALIHHFHRINKSQPKMEIAEPNVEGLNSEQAEAVRRLASQMVTFISGGPGTGKTYTIGRFLKQLPRGLSVALAAPTGKAAANLQASVGRDDVSAKTLHSLLGILKRQFETRKIMADVIIVDECSMIDATLMQHLFAAVKSGSRLVLIGDPHQLPPVEAGSLFGDLIEALPELTVELKTCLRAESQEIIDCAEAINRGESAVKFLELNQFNFPPFPQPYEEGRSSLRLLSPLKKGRFGVERINEYYLRESIKEMREEKLYTFPILITGNDHRMELYNGELGTLIRRGPIVSDRVQVGDIALFGDRRIPALLLPQFSYAYCLSVHKSQGSEFDRVILLLPPGSENFGRKVLYTGVTRAKKELVIWSTQEVVDETIMFNPPRMSGLTFRLRSAI